MATVGVLGGTGFVAASSAAVVSALVWEGVGLPSLVGAPAAAVVLTAVAADLVHARTGRLRPLAVNRQVPQAWGHRRGGLVVAARYGLRLGVAPATILTTWAWWAAVVLGASLGVGGALVAALAFVVVRTATTVGVTAGVRDGRAMAARMGLVMGARSAVARSGSVVAALCGALAFLAR